MHRVYDLIILIFNHHPLLGPLHGTMAKYVGVAFAKVNQHLFDNLDGKIRSASNCHDVSI
jgi:hypothetical protein